ncbi:MULTISPECIES: SPOR domain-containing protein [Pseudomonas]|uniref:Cell division protein n=1 Tax=Pseudomonas protegens TaxID=380021 RepID=A0A2T6GEZ7_9PSED|nr:MULTISPECIES: AAA family ATPase [Pseudomonas]PUA42724.1 cell division protein [Pseudomonas protegens]RXU64731.1 cell division protein [Pseudomonas protegens]ULT70334.1 SPOR domain-containing protein [Pseudomonas sp. BC42]BAQ72138.1 sporulation and cell division repeat protein [Pseudomonas sp. Os17]BAQ78339.1 sporulation and cell division repeat protein [Pseudomonas sp. St29]
MTSLHADEAFLGHYQLSHDPFAPRVPGFKFFPAQRKPVLGQLHHLARYSQLLLVVTGPQGSGKTLLRQALVASTNKQSVQSVVVSARGAGDAAGVLRQVAQALNVAQAEIGAILAQVVQLALTGQEVYLLVDDAEQLDESALEALLALAAGAPEGRPHVFLFGESSLIATLDQLSTEEERFHVIELQPYTEEETREYLAQRLEGAGQGIELFSADQISDIHESSDGWPGNINQVARDAMIEAMIASRSAVKRPSMGFNMPKKHVLAISAVVVVAVAAAWLMPGRSKAPTSGTPTNEQAQLPLGQTPTPNANGSPSVEFAGSSQPMPLPLVGQSQPVMRGPLAEAAGGITEGDDGVPVEGSSAVPPTVTTTAPPAGAVAGPAPTPAARPTPAPTQVATAKPTPAPKPVEKPVAAKPAPAAKPAEKPVTVAKAAGGSWYAGQAPGNYVVQILGTSSEATAQSFVKEQGGEYRYFKKVLNGKPLYVITYGNFSSRDAAVSAIKSLPAKVQAGKPWPRTVASVQQELATTR